MPSVFVRDWDDSIGDGAGGYFWRKIFSGDFRDCKVFMNSIRWSDMVFHLSKNDEPSRSCSFDEFNRKHKENLQRIKESCKEFSREFFAEKDLKND